jgi:hypothetical protein
MTKDAEHFCRKVSTPIMICSLSTRVLAEYYRVLGRVTFSAFLTFQGDLLKEEGRGILCDE